jgi:hypothetical protein
MIFFVKFHVFFILVFERLGLFLSAPSMEGFLYGDNLLRGRYFRSIRNVFFAQTKIIVTFFVIDDLDWYGC